MKQGVLKTVTLFAGTSVLILGVAGWTGDSGAPTRPGKMIVVKTVDVSATEYKFEPASVTVQVGDTVRFEQTAAMPHNVEFKGIPAGAKLGDIMSGPYLTAPGQTYDVVIDARFVAGTYNYVCTPHEMMGMRGVIAVAAGK